MPSTYTNQNGVELMATGEKSGTWGTLTNTNLQILERAISGVGTIDLSGSGAAHTLTTTDATLSDGQYKVLITSGATQACTITVSPNDQTKLFFVNNTSSFSVIFTQGSGGNVTVATTDSAIIYCDGAGAGAEVVDLSALLDFQANDATLTSLAALGTAADKYAYTTGVDTWAEGDITAFGRSLIDDADAATAIATLGLDADIATLALPASTTISAFGATIVDDADAAAVIATLGLDADVATLTLPASTTISAFGASIVDDANAAAVLTTLGVDTDVATLSLPANTTISAFGATLVDDAAASNARTTLGLGAMAEKATVATGDIDDNAVTLAKMAHGTDGNLITYDATGAPANVATGTASQVLTSNGVGAAPTFQDAAGGGAWEKVEDTYDFAVDGAVASVESAAFADGYEYAFDIYNISFSSTEELELTLYQETTAAWGTVTTIANNIASSTNDLFGWVELQLSRYAGSRTKPIIGGAAEQTAGSGGYKKYALTTNSGSTVNLVNMTADEKTGKVRWSTSGGTFDQGVITMLRRPI